MRRSFHDVLTRPGEDMATIAGDVKPKVVKPLIADAYEKALAVGAIVLFVTILVALAKGHGYWNTVPLVIWGHLVTVMFALVLTPVMLLRPRGGTMHRTLGKVWVGAMFLTALESFFVRFSHPGHFSFIHLISLYVVIAAPRIWWSAAHHQVRSHRRQVRGMVTGALLIAGFFTLPPFRLLGAWLLS
jgi:uncharacterized membrane protein